MNESVCARVGVQLDRLEDTSRETELSRREPESRSGATVPGLEVPGKVLTPALPLCKIWGGAPTITLSGFQMRSCASGTPRREP